MSLENARKPNPVGNYLFKANNRITKTRCEICSKLTIKILERRHWRRSGVFLLTLNIFYTLLCLYLASNMLMKDLLPMLQSKFLKTRTNKIWSQAKYGLINCSNSLNVRGKFGDEPLR